MTPLSNKVVLTISQLTFGLRGVQVLRELPTDGYAVVAGPYFEGEMDLLKAALDTMKNGARPAIREETGGVTIYRRLRAMEIRGTGIHPHHGTADGASTLQCLKAPVGRYEATAGAREEELKPLKGKP